MFAPVSKHFKNPRKRSSCKCATTRITVIVTNALPTIKQCVIMFCIKVYEDSGVNYFWNVRKNNFVK